MTRRLLVVLAFLAAGCGRSVTAPVACVDRVVPDTVRATDGTVVALWYACGRSSG